MIPVAYEHPPRSASFYLLYSALAALIMFPLVMIVMLWTSHIEPTPALLLLGVLVFLRLTTFAPTLLLIMMSVEDVGIPKDTDISDKGLQPPDTLADAILRLELEGFERLGEVGALTAGQKQPIPIWAYHSSGGQVVMTVFEIGQPPSPFIAFNTYTENGVVQTMYPRGHQLKFNDARYSGVKSSVEAAYHHHIEEVRAFKPNAGSIINVESLNHSLNLERQYMSPFKKLMCHALIDRVLAEFCLSWVLTLGMLLIAVFLFPGSFAGILGGERLFVGTIFLVAGMVGEGLIGRRTRGIKGAIHQSSI